MAFHFCSHPWEVRDVQDGIVINLTHRHMDTATTSLLVDELLELVRESGRPDLHLDLGDVQQMPSAVVGKMIALNNKLHGHGGRLVLTNVDPGVYDLFRAAQLIDVLDVRERELAETTA
jgi:anti-anti-sigma factor